MLGPQLPPVTIAFWPPKQEEEAEMGKREEKEVPSTSEVTAFSGMDGAYAAYTPFFAEYTRCSLMFDCSLQGFAEYT